jgi:hypothetical protein
VQQRAALAHDEIVRGPVSMLGILTSELNFTLVSFCIDVSFPSYFHSIKTPPLFTFTPASMLSCSSLNLNSFQRSLHQARVPALVAEPIISFLPNPHQARYRRMAICLTLWNRGAGTKLINHLKTSRKRSQWTDEHRGNLLMPDATPYSTFEFIGKVFFF